MARIRSVSPDLCISEVMSRLDARVERTFVRLWTHCDDHGRCLDNPRLLKAALYPLHDDVTADDIDSELEVLFAANLVTRYEIDGARYLSVRSWAEFQHPQKPRASKYPEPSDTSTRPLRDMSGTSPVPDGDDTCRVPVPDEYGPGVEWSGEGVETDLGEGEHTIEHDPSEPDDNPAPPRALTDAIAQHRWPKPTTPIEITQLQALAKTIPEAAILEALDTAGPDEFPRSVAQGARALHARTPTAPRPTPPGDPDCVRCQGRGTYLSGAGFDKRCECTLTDHAPTACTEPPWVAEGITHAEWIERGRQEATA